MWICTHRFDVAMEESSIVNCLDGTQHLRAEPQSGADAEAASALTAPQLRQVLALDRHHHVVKALVTPTANKTTNMVLS